MTQPADDNTARITQNQNRKNERQTTIFEWLKDLNGRDRCQMLRIRNVINLNVFGSAATFAVTVVECDYCTYKLCGLMKAPGIAVTFHQVI